jgi:hypothetical protein
VKRRWRRGETAVPSVKLVERCSAACDSTFARPGFCCSIDDMRIRGLEKKVLDLPSRSRLRIARKIIESVDDFTRKEILAAWSQDLVRRLNGLDSKMKGMSAAQVMAEARRVLNETRKISSTRRKLAG